MALRHSTESIAHRVRSYKNMLLAGFPVDASCIPRVTEVPYLGQAPVVELAIADHIE
jgi:hypothetical protein